VFHVFLQSMLIAYSGAAMPGSLLAYTIDRSLRQGGKTGLLVSLGHSFLEFFVVIFLLLGAANYMETVFAQTVIGIIGGVVLLFLGIGMIKSTFSKDFSINFSQQKDKKYGSLLLGGVFISASNPYFAIWWAAIGLGLVTSAYNSYGVPGAVVFYFGHITADITWYVFVSLLISKTRNFINIKVYRIIILVLGVFLVAMGIRFLIYTFK